MDFNIESRSLRALSFSNPQNGLRFAMQESTEMIACATIGSEPCLTSATLHKQSILCLLSYDAQRLYALWIPNLNPVGFCVVCAFCGNYKQRRHKYKSLSPIKLHFTILSLQISDEPNNFAILITEGFR